MMMGTPEAVTAALDAQAEVAPHVQDDFNVAAGVLDDATDFVDREENQVPCLVALPLLDKRSASTARDTRHGRLQDHRLPDMSRSGLKVLIVQACVYMVAQGGCTLRCLLVLAEEPCVWQQSATNVPATAEDKNVYA